jgi:DNA invertase Pin-like site-specific DNA recombinase
MMGKGRSVKALGSDSGTSKLSEEDVPRIRMLLATGFTGTYIARIYGVGQTTISQIKRGKSWRHV